jgi:deoxyribodipyrimidine photo-lyase
VVLAERVRIANDKPVHERGEYLVYWMQAAQRVHENPALSYAIETANKLGKRLIVCFGLTNYPHAQRVHYEFLLEGLADVAQALSKRGIEFICKNQHPVELALTFDACVIVTDENYTRTPRQWRERLAKEAPVQVVIVDSNLVVPARLREKEEWAAYTIRPKLWKDAPRFLVETTIPVYAKAEKGIANSIPKLTLELAENARRLAHLRGGEVAAHKALHNFIDKLSDYEQRNDPSKFGTSHLSAYLHFGHISPVTIVLAVTAAAAMNKRIDAQAQAFIEQVFVRREVAHNFTYFNEKYDELAGCPDWAQKTLDKHRSDKREFIYTRKELENGKTHDDLWNAAQMEMGRSGYMHNYLRMLWAKKILEWSETPEDAFKVALYLNDVYELDGRDANGYTGVAWSIGGKHDRPWFDRPVYGAIRYMSSDSARKKFDANAYEVYVAGLAPNNQTP